MSSQLSYRLHGREQRPKTLRKHHRDELDTGHKSGNPAGRPTRQITNLAAEARKHFAECIEMLLSFMRGTIKGVTPRDRLAAAMHLLDRGAGKPCQSVDLILMARKISELSTAELVELNTRLDVGNVGEVEHPPAEELN
jgi:hypothetical protein